MNRKLFIAIAALGLAASASAYAGQARNEVTVAALATPAPVAPAAQRPLVKPATWNNVILQRGVGGCGLPCQHGAASPR